MTGRVLILWSVVKHVQIAVWPKLLGVVMVHPGSV